MNLIELYKKDDLDETIEFVKQKEFIMNVKSWLKERNIKIRPQLFISHYILWKFNVFYGVPNNSPLYETCEYIIEMVKNDKDIGYDTINSFNNYFHLWKEAHCNDMLDEYSQTVEKLEEFREAEPAPENKEGYKLFQNTLEKSIDILKKTRTSKACESV